MLYFMVVFVVTDSTSSRTLYNCDEQSCPMRGYPDTSKISSAGWSCPACTDSNGTYYKCTYTDTCGSNYSYSATIADANCTKCSDPYSPENGKYTCTCKSGYYKACNGYCAPTCATQGFTLTSAKDSNKYNCGSCTDNSGTFYACVNKNCASGYTAGITSCTSGYTYSSNGYSGEQVCGKCTTKSCASGYTAGITSCTSGYTYSSNGYSGEQVCGKCTTKSCASGYTAGITS